ncbi:hypothetical protein ACH5RR_040507 [Cinchona calisaya]|uniref:Uncharacterized protein n=1 Tax=Cinchona calisaya TaxID=153742 RepID=A0ABD2XUZ7_9GENT
MPKNIKKKKKGFAIRRVGSDNIHMHSHKGKNFIGVSSRVLYNEVSSIGLVGDVVDDKWATTSGGAEGEERVKHVPHYPVFFGDQLWWIVLNECRLSYQFSQKGHE